MSNIIKKEKTSEVSTEKLSEYLDLFQSTSKLTEIEKNQFIEIAKMSNLNPFKREIYITAYGEGKYRNVSIITGYEVYIKRAEDTDLLDGWHTEIKECNSLIVDKKTGKTSFQKDIKAVITINRKDFKQPFVHEVSFNEYVQKTKEGFVNKFWHEKPQTMLKKVVISQGFRLCFSKEIGGLPYTKEEILDEQQTINVEAEDVTESKKKNELVELFEEAKAGLIDVSSNIGLQKIWELYPELKNIKEWKDLVNKHKKQFENE